MAKDFQILFDKMPEEQQRRIRARADLMLAQLARDNAWARRHFYLKRGLLKLPASASSNLEQLMAAPREAIPIRPGDLFDDIPVLVAGGVATRAYAPERKTRNVDFLLQKRFIVNAVEKLRKRGWQKRNDFTPQTLLGIRRQVWESGDILIDLVTSDETWVRKAFAVPTYDQTGLRVIPLPYLVLIKIDSARGIDQGDLTRMLGRLDQQHVEEIASVVDRYANDPNAAEDVRRYATLGRME